MSLEDFIRKTLKNNRGYKFGRSYETDIKITKKYRTLSLFHYSTEILRIRVPVKMSTTVIRIKPLLVNYTSVSDRGAITNALKAFEKADQNLFTSLYLEADNVLLYITPLVKEFNTNSIEILYVRKRNYRPYILNEYERIGATKDRVLFVKIVGVDLNKGVYIKGNKYICIKKPFRRKYIKIAERCREKILLDRNYNMISGKITAFDDKAKALLTAIKL